MKPLSSDSFKSCAVIAWAVGPLDQVGERGLRQLVGSGQGEAKRVERQESHSQIQQLIEGFTARRQLDHGAFIR